MIPGIMWWVFILPLNRGRQLCNEVVRSGGGARKNKGKIHFDELNEALLNKMSS